MAQDIDAYTISDADTPQKHNRLVEQIRKWIFDPLKIFNVKEIKTDILTPTDLTITTGALKTLILGTPVYDDLYAGIASAKLPAANYPDWTTFTTNTGAYTFKVNDYVDLATVEVSHNHKESTDLEFHIHLANNGVDTTDRYVKFVIYYTYALPNAGTSAFSAEATLTAELKIPANTPTRSSFYLSMGTISGTNIFKGTQIKIRIKRITATGGTAPTSNPYVGMVGIHHQIDKLGSVTMT